MFCTDGVEAADTDVRNQGDWKQMFGIDIHLQ